jgi:hypothetical protein
MKKLFLLGDSIRLGYEPLVREKLVNRMEVFSPEGVNCQFAQFTLCHLHEWGEKTGCADEIDLVHWNNGLWDVLHRLGDECLTSIDIYAIMLKRIYKRIGIIFPRAKVIYALTTPVIESRFEGPNFFRRNNEIREYNAIASRIMGELNVDVNDLYSLASGFPEDFYADTTHFTEKGYDLLAEAVVKVCES